MSTNDISEATYPDSHEALPALQRAAELARQVAIQTGTDLVVVRDGRLVRVDPVTREERPQNPDASAP